MTGGSGDRPCGRGRDCRPDAGSGLMGQEKGANSHTGQSWKTAALIPPRDRLRMGAGHFYAGAVVPLSWGFML